MPKNEKSKKNSAKRTENIKRELVIKENVPDSEYGRVIRALGDCNFAVECADGMERMCHIRKSIKRSYVLADSIILVGKRSYQPEKGDIIYVYSYEEATKLRNMGEITFSLNECHTNEDGGDEKEDNVEFEFDFEEI